jgi:hypothetical protein
MFSQVRLPSPNLHPLERSSAKWKGRSVNGGLHKRSAEDWGKRHVRARGLDPLEV